MSEPVLYESADAVATITLNRPDVLNAMNDALTAGLLQAVERAADDRAVRAVLITGAGRGFCAGADLAATAASNAAGSETSPAAPRDLGETLRSRYHPIILGIRRMEKPVISAVNGVAAGAGMSLALSADIVLSAQSASFLQAFAKIGLIPDAGSTWLLDRYAGAMRGRAMAMLAEPVSADDARQFGLVWRVFPDAELMPAARQLAVKMAAMPTRAFALIKQAMDAAAGNDLAAQLEVEATLQGRAGLTDDFREGVSAFLAKRAPTFKGR